MSSSPIAIHSPASGELQFEMSVDSMAAEASVPFVYESCSGDYNMPHVLCKAGGDQLGGKPSSGVQRLMACYWKPSFPGVPVIKASGIVTNQASLFAALVVPVPVACVEPDTTNTASATHSAITEHVTPDSDDTDSTPPPTESSTLPPTSSPEPVPSLQEIRHQIKQHRQAHFKLCIPFFKAENLPIELPVYLSRAGKLYHVRGRLEELSAAKKELEVVVPFRARLAKFFSRG